MRLMFAEEPGDFGKLIQKRRRKINLINSTSARGPIPRLPTKHTYQHMSIKITATIERAAKCFYVGGENQEKK